jgi:hypothetical protein
VPLSKYGELFPFSTWSSSPFASRIGELVQTCWLAQKVRAFW